MDLVRVKQEPQPDKWEPADSDLMPGYLEVLIDEEVMGPKVHHRPEMQLQPHHTGEPAESEADIQTINTKTRRNKRKPTILRKVNARRKSKNIMSQSTDDIQHDGKNTMDSEMKIELVGLKQEPQLDEREPADGDLKSRYYEVPIKEEIVICPAVFPLPEVQLHTDHTGEEEGEAVTETTNKKTIKRKKRIKTTLSEAEDRRQSKNNVPKSTDGQQCFVCDVCTKKFCTKWSLKCHLRIHDGSCPFACNLCGKIFTTKGNLNKHLLTHYGEKPFACSVCDKKFSQSGSLTTHMRIHTGEKPFACNECDRKFTRKSRLTEHTRIHNGVRLYVCSVCDKKLSTSSNLTTHMRIHSGEKPFACSVCNKNFADASCLTRHMRIHTGEKRYSCNVCDKKFIQNVQLTKHMRVHFGEPYSCTLCDKKIAHLRSLTIHMRIHNGEKPFVCSVCDKKFVTSSCLTRHARIHDGVKPYACRVCDKKFTQKSNLNSHMSKVHDKGLNQFN